MSAFCLTLYLSYIFIDADDNYIDKYSLLTRYLLHVPNPGAQLEQENSQVFHLNPVSFSVRNLIHDKYSLLTRYLLHVPNPGAKLEQDTSQVFHLNPVQILFTLWQCFC